MNANQALRVAVRKENGKEVTKLLLAGLSPNTPDGWGETPLMLATQANIAYELIKHGADVNARDASGHTPLLRAVQRNKVNVVKVLVIKGADIYAKNNLGDSALDIAKERGYKEIAEYIQWKDEWQKEKDAPAVYGSENGSGGVATCDDDDAPIAAKTLSSYLDSARMGAII